jgi:flagellar basal-body rod protein FlgC
MDLGIRGRTALVCAASKGLGKGCAEALAREGVNLVITARGKEALEATASELRKHGVKVQAVLEDQGAFAQRYDPGNPSADGAGYVSVPNVEVAEEMVDMVSAARAYQANLTAIGLIRDTIARALELAK